jgi:predicted transcriptional regulator
MSISQADIDSFHQFATLELARQGSGLSLESLVDQWREQQEHETLDSIRRGVDDAAAGRLRSLAEVDAQIRSQLGFTPRGR